jgi:predicted metal-dependent RNase
MISPNDRLPMWRLVKDADMPFRRLTSVVADLGLPMEDDKQGTMYTSRSALREVLLNAAAKGGR